MKLSSFRYIVPEAFRSMRRNAFTTFAAVATVMITLFLCAIFWLLGQNLDANAAAVESSVELAVYLEKDVPAARVAELREQLLGLEGVASLTFIGKEEALERMNEKFGSLYYVLGDANPLMDGFSLFAEAPEHIAPLAEQIAALPDVQMVRGNDGTVESLFAFTSALRKADFALMCLLGLAAVVLISMSIRITVFTRQKEVMVMKWLGSSNWFIRWPFVLEGVFIGVLGAVMAAAACFYIYSAVGKYLLQNDLTFILFLNVRQVWLPVALFMLGTGVIMGCLGSALSLRRFLNV
ncbi:MAG: permease-like cell division protein FtsX [Clostridiales bacterium]|nr:permease-like cell division protein FtsX [Clostridiales bacterium]